MKELFLGIDTGATKSHALIADAQGQVHGFASGGPGNWEVIGWDGTHCILTDIITQAAAQAGVAATQLAGAGFGLAGYDWPEDGPPHEQIIRAILGSDVPFALVNDAFIGLPAGTDAGWGVVVGAGTSCNCYGRNPQGDIGRVIGAAALGDEHAGAGELVLRAMQAIAKQWTQRGPKTALSEAFIAEVGAVDVADFLAGRMRGRYSFWAEKAPLVFQVAAAGDAVALELVRWAGSGLGSLAVGVIRQLGIADLTFDVVQAGSFYNGSPLVTEAMVQTVHAVAPKARLVRLHAPPVVGATLLGMEQRGVATAVARQPLIANIRAHLSGE